MSFVRGKVKLEKKASLIFKQNQWDWSLVSIKKIQIISPTCFYPLLFHLIF